MENINIYLKAVVEADTAPVVICNTEHIIIYMNACAIKRYAKRGGADLIGKSIFDCHNSHSIEIIKAVTSRFENEKDLNKLFTYNKNWDNEDSDVYMVALRDETGKFIGYYEKHESRIHENIREK